MMTLDERITVNPEQCGGRPCIRGMRIPERQYLETHLDDVFALVDSPCPMTSFAALH